MTASSPLLARLRPTVLALAAFTLLQAVLPGPAPGAPEPASTVAPATGVRYKTAEIGGMNIFYREAGPAGAPNVLLLHGFGGSSFMFRDLIPKLAGKYHVIAPDLPGFGQTDTTGSATYKYDFENIAATMTTFTETLKLDKYFVYVFDYGAPTGFRMALAHPERIAGIISQNGNAYEEGLGKVWSPIQAYWKDPSAANRAALRPFLKLETTKWQYTHGVSDPTMVAPDGYVLATAAIDRPGNAEIQLDLFGDYKSNVALYPKFHEYFRKHKPPTLVVWGKNDPFFIPPGAEAFKRDNPAAEVKFHDTGHFALETHGAEIGDDILAFLAKNAR